LRLSKIIIQLNIMNDILIKKNYGVFSGCFWRRTRKNSAFSREN
jgi:hypothetical protein